MLAGYHPAQSTTVAAEPHRADSTAVNPPFYDITGYLCFNSYSSKKDPIAIILKQRNTEH